MAFSRLGAAGLMMWLVCDVVGKDPWGDVPFENAFLKGNLHKTLLDIDTAGVSYADSPAETITFIKHRVLLYERVLKTAAFKDLIKSGLLNELCHNNGVITKEVLDLRPATLSSQDALEQIKQVIRGNLVLIRAKIPLSESPTTVPTRRLSSRRRLHVSTAPADAHSSRVALPSSPPSESNLTFRLSPPPTDLGFLSRPRPHEGLEHQMKWHPPDMPIKGAPIPEQSVKRTPRIRFRHPRHKQKHAELAGGFGETTDDWPELNGPPGSIVPSGVLEKSTNWELGPRGCFYLRVLRPRRSWKNAVEACRALAPGAHLADPESLEGERNFPFLCTQANKSMSCHMDRPLCFIYLPQLSI